MYEYLSSSTQNTENIAAEIAIKIKKGDYIALYGEMGVGKTAFVRGLVSSLAPECAELVHSPTFAIVNEYIGKKVKIYHFDLYRIKSEDDLYSTGFYDYADGENIIITEWSELFEEIIPPNAVKIQIKKTSETGRRITIC